MTRSHSLFAIFISCLTLPACKDVPIGGDSTKSRLDAGKDATLVDAGPDAATCSGANPAAQKCRKNPNDCIPSVCTCSADGFWQCTADCPVNVPLCADAGMPGVASDVALPDLASPDLALPDLASPDLASPDIASPDAATCSGTNPAAQKCRKTVNDCIPTSCSCSADGFWHCTADCPAKLPLCADAGAPDLAGDGGVPISDGGAQRTFTRTGSMTAARTKHTATLLANGKVLIAGGSSGNNALASAEIYDPATGSFAATGTLTAARLGHTATLLASGKVLIVSGSSAELYDPATGTFTAIGNPTVARTEHTATLLAGGKVLVAGGYSGADALVSAELYDPATGKFTATGNLTVARRQHAATLLQSGMVLLAGGFVPPTNTGNNDGLASAELYDPAAATFTATGSMQARRSPAIATLLADGTVLVGGGWHGFEGYFDTSTLELYDPATGQFAPTGGMAVKRTLYTATLLPNGSVLIAGGSQHSPSSFVYLSSAELYDPAASTCTPTASMAEQREYHTATALPDGTVLIAGGDRFGSAPALASAEIYK